jgi:hypothetical protein
LSRLFPALSARADVDIFQISPANVSKSSISVQVTNTGLAERFTVCCKTNETTSDKFIHADLQISEGGNKIVSSVPVEKIWTAHGVEFEFMVSAAYLTTSKFTITEQGHVREMGMPDFANWWFYLRDFATRQTNAITSTALSVAKIVNPQGSVDLPKLGQAIFRQQSSSFSLQVPIGSRKNGGQLSPSTNLDLQVWLLKTDGTSLLQLGNPSEISIGSLGDYSTDYMFYQFSQVPADELAGVVIRLNGRLYCHEIEKTKAMRSETKARP